MTNQTTFSGYKVAAGLFISLFANIGSLPIITLFIPEFMKEFQVGFAAISPIITLGTISAFVVLLIASKILPRIGPKRGLLLGTVFIVIELIGFGLAQTIYQVYYVCIIVGFGLAFGGTAPVATIISNWFHTKKKTVMGIVIGAFGMGSSVWLFIAGQLIHQFGYRKAYFVLAACIFILGIGANLLLVRNKPEDMGQKMLGWEELEEKPQVNADTIAAGRTGYTGKEAHKTAAFWLLMAAVFFGGSLLSTYRDWSVTLWQANGVSPVTSSYYISLVLLCGSLVVMVSGWYNEKFGAKKYLLTLFGVYIVSCSLSVMFGVNQSQTLLIISLLTFMLAYPLGVGLSEMTTLNIMGPGKGYLEVVAQANGAMNAGHAVLAVAIGFVADKTGSLSTAYGMLAILAATGCVLFLIALYISPLNKRTSVSPVNTRSSMRAKGSL